MVEAKLKVALSRDQREYIQFYSVQRKEDLVCLGRVKGKILNILDGLEFSSMLQNRTRLLTLSKSSRRWEGTGSWKVTKLNWHIAIFVKILLFVLPGPMGTIIIIYLFCFTEADWFWLIWLFTAIYILIKVANIWFMTKLVLGIFTRQSVLKLPPLLVIGKDWLDCLLEPVLMFPFIHFVSNCMRLVYCWFKQFFFLGKKYHNIILNYINPNSIQENPASHLFDQIIILNNG